MAFQIQRGLFGMDFTDHHAILGVAIEADAKEIRKRYLKIARSLHPDSFATSDPSAKQQANEFLSKMVNPTYEKLSQDKERTEYNVVVRLKGQQAVRQRSSLQIDGELAKQISGAPNVEQAYKEALQKLAEKQYQELDKTLDITGEISELNLIYLLHKYSTGEAGKPAPAGAPPAAATKPSSSSSSSAPPPPPAAARVSPVEQYYRRAQEYYSNNNLAQAILELREALQLEPNNGRCHSLMGAVYLKQKQATMAKIHFNKALQLNPNDEIAQKGIEQIEKLSGGKTTQASGNQKAAPKKPDQQGKSGGFFGLFGGKKK